MKKRNQILLSCLVCASLASCKKENIGSIGASSPQDGFVEVSIDIEPQDTKSDIWDDPSTGEPNGPIGTVTLWSFLSGSETPESCISFETDGPLPSLWLREGHEYSFIAVSNIDLDNTPGGDYAHLNKEKIFSYYYSQAHHSPVGNKLPLFAKENISCASGGTTLSIHFKHSWAKIVLIIDDAGLNGGYQPTSVTLYKTGGIHLIDQYDRASSAELQPKGKAISLYCPGDTTAWSKVDRLPFIKIAGDLTGSFAGTVTYRIRIGQEFEIFAPNQYTYTFKPTLEHLINKTKFESEVEDDIVLADFSQLKIVAELDHSINRSKYSKYYPSQWQNLSSSSGSEFSISLYDKGQNIPIPRKWYNLTQQSGKTLSIAAQTTSKTTFKTTHLGETTFLFTPKSHDDMFEFNSMENANNAATTPKATTSLSYSVTTIWQPTIKANTTLPACPDTDISTVQLGTELTALRYTGTINAQAGSSIVPYTFTSNATTYSNNNTLLDNCYTYSSIRVQGRTENPRIPIVCNDLAIIESIQKDTENALWGSAYNLKIVSKTIKYTFPSNYPTYQQYVFPHIPSTEGNISLNPNGTKDIYINNRIFH